MKELDDYLWTSYTGNQDFRISDPVFMCVKPKGKPVPILPQVEQVAAIFTSINQQSAGD